MTNCIMHSTTFTPTYLYIKQHSVTSKMYFGKTIENPETYQGSGTHWKRHIKKHSKQHILTLWYCLFFDKETISEFALMCSEQWNIVKSKEWLNMIPENGSSGACPGVPTSDETKLKMSIAKSNMSDETRLKMSIAKTDTIHSDETKLKMSIASKGKPKSEEHKMKMCKPKSDETKLKIGAANTGKLRSDETKLKMSIDRTGRSQPIITCPHCGKSGGILAMKRWHFDNCKMKVII